MNELKKKAKELDIKFDDDIEKDDLQKLIDDKEEEIKAQDNNAEFLKGELEKWKAEAKTAFEKRDTFKADRDKMKKKVKDLEDNMKGMTDSETFNNLKEQFEDLKKFKDDIDKKKEKDKLDKMDEVERLNLKLTKSEKEFKKQMDDMKVEFEKEKEEKENELKKERDRVARLRKSTLDVTIMEAAVKANAFSPSQVVKLTKGDFTYDDQLDKYSFIKRDEKGKAVDELTVDEYVSEYLGREDNENLVKSDANTGSFHSDKDKNTDKSKHTSSSKYDPKDEDIIREASDRDMTPERYIKTLEKRDQYKKEKEELNKE